MRQPGSERRQAIRYACVLKASWEGGSCPRLGDGWVGRVVARTAPLVDADEDQLARSIKDVARDLAQKLAATIPAAPGPTAAEAPVAEGGAQ